MSAVKEYPPPAVWDGRDVPYPSEMVRLFSQCRKFDVAIHAGRKEWLRWLSLKFSTVYTFEPDLERFISLTADIRRFNVVAVLAELGDHRGPVTRMRDLRIITVPVIRIDDFNLQSCDAVVIDDPGIMKAAMIGGERTLRTLEPLFHCPSSKTLTCQS